MAYKTKEMIEEENRQLADANQALNQKYDALENELYQIREMLTSTTIDRNATPLEEALTKIVYQQQQNTAPISVGSLDVNGVTISIDGRDERITEPIQLSLESVVSILKSPRNRKLFENGVLYFLDEQWYDYFRIDKGKILTDEMIIGIFKGENEDIIHKLDQLTDSKSVFSSMFQIPFKIAILLNEKKLLLDIDQQEIIENYFGYLIKDVRARLQFLKKYNK